MTPAYRLMAALLVSVAAVPALAVALTAAAVFTQTSATPTEAGDVPAAYLTLYGKASSEYRLGAVGWSYLAGVGKVECDHGRSQTVGCHRGEANAAGARGPAQFLPATWAQYGVDADGDGLRDIYGPSDAVFGMANYLRASGAPADWRRALFAYNHDTAYVELVNDWARRYRAAAAPGFEISRAGGWLSDLPGAPGTRCDTRIIADVLALIRAYGLRVTSCFGGAPHAIDGEHPLGLAVDAVPSDLNWARTKRLAIDYGWAPACAAAGCGGRGPFRAVLYNGFPGHGDPAHTGNPHLHLSWDHAPAEPFTRAAWVRTLLAPSAGAGRSRCSNASSSTGGTRRSDRSRRPGAGGGCSA